MKLVIEGAPRTKKTSQYIAINKRTGKPMVMSAKTSQGWERSAIQQLLAQLRCDTQGLFVPVQDRVSVRALIYRDARRGDLCGYLQAIGDALQGGGRRKGRVPCVLADDAQIQSWDHSRLLVDRERPRVEIEIEPFAERTGP